MLNKLFNYYFWFTQPSSILSNSDSIFGYISLALLIAAVVFRLLVSFNKNQINQKLFRKIWHLAVTIGIFGLVWYGFRFENTPIFAERIWFGLIALIGLIWGLFVLKYLTFDFMKEKSEFERESLKNKYIPKSK